MFTLNCRYHWCWFWCGCWWWVRYQFFVEFYVDIDAEVSKVVFFKFEDCSRIAKQSSCDYFMPQIKMWLFVANRFCCNLSRWFHRSCQLCFCFWESKISQTKQRGKSSSKQRSPYNMNKTKIFQNKSLFQARDYMYLAIEFVKRLSPEWRFSSFQKL